MIKLMRPDKPKELEKNETSLTEEYKKTGKSVWRKDYIVKALMEMSHNKCCYCETNLTTQVRNMEVEHYHFKDGYPDEVVSWENLLPSCRQCNSNKGTYDTIKDGDIIKPTDDDPRDYLYLHCFMIKSKDNALESKGRKTVDILDLNNRTRLVNPRIQIASEIDEKLQNIYEKMCAYANRQDGKQYGRSRITNGILDLLKLAQPDAEYSAFISTVLSKAKDYQETKKMMETFDLWTSEMEDLHNTMISIKLDTK